MPTIELDYSNDDDTFTIHDTSDAEARRILDTSVRAWLDEYGFADVTFDVKQAFGPAGGAAVIDFTAPDADRMHAFVTMYDAGNGEVAYLLEGVRA